MTARHGTRTDRLRLIFTCCHPALAREAQVALTLRLVCGVSTGDIAAAFLVGESAMAARVTRAKRKIATARIPFRVPDAWELPERVAVVCEVLYLVFTVGHAPPSGDAVVRADLVDEAIALTRMLRGLLPADRSVAGLLALMLLIDARRGTRDELLADQDRSRWDRALIDEGLALAGDGARRERWTATRSRPRSPPCTRRRRRGATPTGRGSPTSTGCSAHAWQSPVVALNSAVAVGMRDGPAAGLAAVDAVAADPALVRYPYLPAARAAFLMDLGRWGEAAEAYADAARLAGSEAERQRLEEQTARARALT